MPRRKKVKPPIKIEDGPIEDGSKEPAISPSSPPVTQRSGEAGKVSTQRNFITWRNGILALLLTVSASTVVALVKAWNAERDAQITCSFQMEPAPPLRYIELQLTGQHPIEPTFSGHLFAHLQGVGLGEIGELRVTRSSERGYAKEVYSLPMSLSPDHRMLRSTKTIEMSLVTTTGQHRDFPFDSGIFDFSLSLEPPTTFSMVRVVNRVPGFVADCTTAKLSRDKDSSLHITFTLRRSPLLQLAVIILVIGFCLCLGFILTLHDTKTIFAATGSLFFSIWTLRNFLSTTIHIFPTLLDCALLVLGILVILTLSWKALLQPSQEG